MFNSPKFNLLAGSSPHCLNPESTEQGAKPSGHQLGGTSYSNEKRNKFACSTDLNLISTLVLHHTASIQSAHNSDKAIRTSMGGTSYSTEKRNKFACSTHLNLISMLVLHHTASIQRAHNREQSHQDIDWEALATVMKRETNLHVQLT